jgi:hypothetical protein
MSRAFAPVLRHPLRVALRTPPGRRSAAAAFSPLALFAAGEKGAWYDPSDFSTMFQDSAGTTPVTATGQPVGLIRDKSGRGSHASQATAASRPTLQQDASGFYYLSFDGVDDGLVTAANVDFSATSKITVAAGVNFSNTTNANIVTLSPTAFYAANPGAFEVTASEVSVGAIAAALAADRLEAAPRQPGAVPVLPGVRVPVRGHARPRQDRRAADVLRPVRGRGLRRGVARRPVPRDLPAAGRRRQEVQAVVPPVLSRRAFNEQDYTWTFPSGEQLLLRVRRQRGRLLELPRPRIPVDRLRGADQLAVAGLLRNDAQLLPQQPAGHAAHGARDLQPLRPRARRGEGAVPPLRGGVREPGTIIATQRAASAPTCTATSARTRRC